MCRRTTLAGAVVALALGSSPAALAQEVVRSIIGDVRVGNAEEPLRPMRDGERLGSGSRIATGAASRVILRFADGQRVVLGQNTELRVVDYRYDPAKSQLDRALFDLLKGSARFVTGLIGQRNPAAIAMRTPQAMIGVRGTDFSVAVIQATHVSVRRGMIVANNAAGSLVFGSGVAGAVASAEALPAAVAAAALPADVAASFADLNAVAPDELGTEPTAGGAAGGARAAAGFAASSVSGGALLAIGAAAALLLLIADDDSSATTHH